MSLGADAGTNAKIGTYNINLKINDPYGDNKLKLITLTITYPVSAKNTEKIELQRLKTYINEATTNIGVTRDNIVKYRLKTSV